MLLDVAELEEGCALAADVCVVGCGPAGIALARELADGGLSVVVLESGRRRIEAASAALNEAVVSGLPVTGHVEGRGRVLGGTGRLWAGQCLPLDPIDFETRPWVPWSGWPIDHDALAPYLGRAERFFRIEREPYDERAYAMFGLRPPAWEPGTLRTMFTVYTPDTDVGRHHSSFLASSARIRVVLGATATEVATDATGRSVLGCPFRSVEGRTGRVHAGRVVLCSGGLENARLLLASRGAGPAGLGNGRDLVGRFFQDHPNGFVADLVGPGAHLQDRFRLLYGRGRRWFPKFALHEDVQRRERTLNCNAHLVFEYPDDGGVASLQEIVRAVRARRMPDDPALRMRRVLANLPEIGDVVLRRFRGGSPKAVPSAVRVQCHVEQAPDPDSRVTLDEGSTDALGMPRLRIDWRMSDMERRTVDVATRTVAEQFARAGLGTLEPRPWTRDPDGDWRSRLRDSFHHAGTTRMADDPSMGVVDPHGEVFGTHGLHVCGGSVFPTSGYANPTLSIVALAIRMGDRIRERAASTPTGSRAA